MTSTPDTILKWVLIGLATSDFEGINATKFWDFVTGLCGELDEFTKTVIWNWLLKDPNFEVLRKNPEFENDYGKNGKSSSIIREDKDTLPNFQDFFNDENINDYTIKVSDDYQSLYLTGVQQKDNILGKMPYDLLRIIAKHKEAGINSLDLIEESGQDKRSLTNRLQVLEDNLLISKYSVVVKHFSTNHMVHYRFAKSLNEKDEIAPDFYDRYMTMGLIIDAVKKEENKIRLTRDLFEEIKQGQPIFKIRWFNKILKVLVDNGFIEMIQVEHTETNRFFAAVRYLKDLPPNNKKTEFLEKIREQGLNSKDYGDDTFDTNEVDETNEIINQPRVNRFFPLANQIRDLIQSNPGIMNATIDTELTGIYSTRQIPNIVESISSNIPCPENPNGIIGQLFQMGKTKFYRFTTQNLLNRRDPNYKFVEPVEDEIAVTADSTLFEESINYGSSYSTERRLKVVKIADDNLIDKYYLIPRGYSGKLGSKLAATVTTRSALQGRYHSENNLIAIDTKSMKAEKNLELFKEIVDERLNNICDFNKKAEKLEFITNEKNIDGKQSPLIEAVIDNEKRSEIVNIEKMETTQLDYGPEFRRKKLKELADKKKCICINRDFCVSLSSAMKLDYLIDRRTLIRDATYLAEKELIEIERLDNKFVVKSINNPPSEDDVKETLVDNPRGSSGPRKFSAKVQFQNIPVRNENTLIRGWKNENRDTRLKSAVKALNVTSKRKTRYKKVVLVGVDENEKLDDIGEVDDENNEENELFDEKNNEDMIEPLMDDRKRKKLKAANKSQVRVAKAFKKIRTSIKVTNDHILLLIKAIIVSQSLSVGGNIDWPKVSNVLDDIYGIATLRRQWPRHKKMLGQRNLLHAKKNWEAALLDAVSRGDVTSADLENYDIFKMLDLWKGNGADIFIGKSEFEISSNYEDNFKTHYFKPLKDESGLEVFREPPSMIEKEHSWASKNFMYPVDASDHLKLLEECEKPTSLQLAKTKLKALFATNSSKFSSNRVRHLFSGISKELYSEALTQLEDKKAIAFLGEDSKIKFTLTDRLMLTLDCKLNDEFVKNAMRMCEVFDDIDTTHNGILLSTRCSSGCYASIFSLFSKSNIVVTRVDQKMDSMKSYYTKSQDRSKLESDFLITHYNKDSVILPKKVPEPLDSPCSLLWVDLAGDLNEKLWHKCVYVLLWSIVFNPGTPINTLCARIHPLLEPFEVKRILDWLIMRGNIYTREFGGYWPTEFWYNVK